MSYREPSSDDSEHSKTSENSSTSEDFVATIEPKRTRLPPQSFSKPVPRKRKKGKAKFSRVKQFNSKKTVSAKPDNSHESTASEYPPQLLERIPPWQTLPYEILLQIFYYAAHPLCNDTFDANPSVSWLSKSARICKAFAEPALSVLYYAPPFTPPQAKGLLALLASETPTTFAYGRKIKYLDMIAVHGAHAPVHKSGDRRTFQLIDLIEYTPQLRGIGLHLLTDQPQFNKRGSNPSAVRNKDRLIYRKELFSALEKSKITLLSWKWTFANFSPDLTVDGSPLEVAHSYSFLRSLQTLVLVEYCERDIAQDARLADVIRALPNLKQLSLELFSWSADDFLQLLPQNLESLRLIDCRAANSENLYLFLATHGRNLRELILNHNQYLNLAFTVDLANSCPKLEIMKMNLRYYSAYYTFQDSEPKFDALLLPSQKPTWPASLQCLDLSYLRKWGRESAEMLFSSILGAAVDLPDLRILIIKAIVDLGWRDRASFRSRWESGLKKVFLRNAPDPNPQLRSIQAYYNSKAQTSCSTLNGHESHPQQNGLKRLGLRQKCQPLFSHVEIKRQTGDSESRSDSLDESNSDIKVEEAPKRRSRRLQKQESDMSISPGTSFANSKPLSGRRKKRKRAQSASSSIDSALSDVDENTISSQGANADSEGLIIQGLCNTVTIQIDNLRPMEDQFQENDFLDEEASGDEDWNGDDSIAGEGYAW